MRELPDFIGFIYLSFEILEMIEVAVYIKIVTSLHMIYGIYVCSAFYFVVRNLMKMLIRCF